MILISSQSALAIPGWWCYKVFENGGNGTQGSPLWLCRGTGMTTQAYSSMMAGPQGKINSCYVSHVSSTGVLNQAEVGWLWMGTESNAPMYFAATIKDSAVNEQTVWLIDWFTPGASHHYRTRHVRQGSNEQIWGVYIDYAYVGTIGGTYLVDGWSHVGGERSTDTWIYNPFPYVQRVSYECGGNAEYTYCEKWKDGSWSAWTQANDWDYWNTWNLDTDSDYVFLPHAANVGWIRQGNG